MTKSIPSLQLILLVFSYQFTFSQSGDLHYLDKDFMPCTKDSAFYFRTIEPHPDRTEKVFTSTYYTNGRLESSVTYLNNQLILMEAFYRSFYENGNKKEEGFYNLGKPVGKWKKWYSNGQLAQNSFFEKTTYDYEEVKEEIIDQWDIDGAKLVSGGNGIGKIYHDDTLVIAETGEYKNGFAVGLWTGYYPGGERQFEEIRKSGKKKGVSWDLEGNEFEYKKAEVQAEPEKGLDAFYKYISTGLTYPKGALMSDVEGRIFVVFMIEKNGKIGKVAVMGELSDAINKAAKRVLLNGPKWSAGKSRGMPTRQKLILPVTYTIGDSESKDCNDCNRKF